MSRNQDGLEFWKIQATGNDFVLLDGRYGLACDPAALATQLTDRHFGVGANALLVLEASKTADFRMVYFNVDGSRAICGNGVRAIAHFVHTQGLLPPEQKKFEIETDTEAVPVTVSAGGKRASITISGPSFRASDVPVHGEGEHVSLTFCHDGEEYVGEAVGIGNPHCVFVVDDIDTAPVNTLGPIVEQSELFPERANVEFVQVVSKDALRMRIWERGVGYSLACGTGIAAAAVSCILRFGLRDSLHVEVPGGMILLGWDRASNKVTIEGQVTTSFRGEWLGGLPS